MPEVDIEKQLKRYWENFRRQMSDEDAEKLDRLLEEEQIYLTQHRIPPGLIQNHY